MWKNAKMNKFVVYDLVIKSVNEANKRSIVKRLLQ